MRRFLVTESARLLSTTVAIFKCCFFCFSKINVFFVCWISRTKSGLDVYFLHLKPELEAGESFSIHILKAFTVPKFFSY